MRKKNKLIYGVGINDADYVVIPTLGGKRTYCYFYQTWLDMIRRCYSEKWKIRHQTYNDCTCDPDWLTFSKFKKWMETQDWRGNELDKDLLIPGNSLYSPETCVFVSQATNIFSIDRVMFRGEFPLGVSFHKRDKKFTAQCSNPFTKKRESLGYFDCQNKAHLAWKKRKHELACQLADLQPDERVAAALRLRYA